MSKKFSTLLLTGKAATLPLLMQQAQAAVELNYTNILTSQLSQVQLPVNNQVSLGSLGSASSGTYGSTDGAATLCSDSAVPSQMTVVLTGLKNGDQVFLATALNSTGNEGLDSRIKVGTTKLHIPVSTVVTAPTGATIAMSIPLDLTDLQSKGYDLIKGKKFYMQSLVFPSGSYGNGSFNWAQAKISELDVISVGSCTGSYGGSTY